MATPRRRKALSEPTIARLPIYQRIVEEAYRLGTLRLESKRIAELAGVTATTVRRDLAGLGNLGTRGAGYETNVVAQRISEALGQDHDVSVAVVGMGNLGRALVNSNSFLIRGANLTGLYDVDPGVIGTTCGGLVVRDLGQGLDAATVGVICTPPDVAQAVADQMVASGIHAILNFAPQVIVTPIGTAVHYVDFSIELQVLMYHLLNGTGPLGGVPLHSLGVTPPPLHRTTS